MRSQRTAVRSKRAVLGHAASTCMLAAVLSAVWAPPVDAQRVTETERVGGGGGDPTPDGAWQVRGSQRAALKSGTRLATNDSLGMLSPWVVHVELSAGDFGRGKLSLATDVRLETEETVIGPAAGSLGSSFKIEENPCGGQRVRIHRGALTVKLWPADHPLCTVAVGARLRNRGTAYGLRVDDASNAYLGVTEDSVSIFWYGRATEQEPTLPCDGNPNDATPCVQVAPQGTVWTWSYDLRPTEVRDPEEPPPLPFVSWADARAGAVDFLGKDIYDDFTWWPAIPVVVAVGACVIFDVWPCGGGDVSGNVILNP